MKKSPLEGPSLDRKEFFAFSRSSWYKSLPRSLSPDERCTRVLMAQFQSPRCGSIPGVICILIPSNEDSHTSHKNPEMSNKPNVNEVSKAHLDPKEQEVEHPVVTNHSQELQDFNTAGKYR
ncbi:hypothetical protein TNIN_11061 [Trichonephila inaurata madagascariensis]|uniref:Uncharacterized protein n=1 Tax=Trichonephila inaurata madagascariensis TaxID=2747483 RepID=A0A8X6WSB7_9ARAC|nr:hypothetical protein TNIN_11061 [Trichonephila inaurata madagascariensis]